MSRRSVYGWIAGLALVAELVIGFWVRDRFVRPYLGDVLVAVMLCCLWRFAFPKGSGRMPFGMFLFCAGVEFFQLLRLPDRWGITDTLLGVVLGSTFDWKDIFCYGIGCGLFWIWERSFLEKR